MVWMHTWCAAHAGHCNSKCLLAVGAGTTIFKCKTKKKRKTEKWELTSWSFLRCINHLHILILKRMFPHSQGRIILANSSQTSRTQPEGSRVLNRRYKNQSNTFFHVLSTTKPLMCRAPRQRTESSAPQNIHTRVTQSLVICVVCVTALEVCWIKQLDS